MTHNKPVYDEISDASLLLHATALHVLRTNFTTVTACSCRLQKDEGSMQQYRNKTTRLLTTVDKLRAAGKRLCCCFFVAG